MMFPLNHGVMAAGGADLVESLLEDRGEAWDFLDKSLLFTDSAGTTNVENEGDLIKRANGVAGTFWLDENSTNSPIQYTSQGFSFSTGSEATLSTPSSQAGAEPGIGSYDDGFIWAVSFLDDVDYFKAGSIGESVLSGFSNNQLSQLSSNRFRVRYRASSYLNTAAVLEPGLAFVRTVILRAPAEDPSTPEIYVDGSLSGSGPTGTNDTIGWPSFTSRDDGAGNRRRIRRAFVKTGDLSAHQVQELHQWLAGGAS